MVASKFEEVDMSYSDSGDRQWTWHTDLGFITVLDRRTRSGNGIRDTETGFRDPDGAFWLASGMQDVRDSSVKTWGEAVQWVKDHANTCKGKVL